jgi:hypothetical protein
MSKFNRVHLLGVVFAGLELFCGCAREIVIDLPQESPKIVVVCEFVNGAPFRANLSFSQPIYDDSPPKVPDFRTVDFSISSGGTYKFSLFHRYDPVSGALFFQNDTSQNNINDTIKTNVSYSMSVKIPGYPNVSAESKVPVFNPLSPMQVYAEEITELPLSDGRRELRVPLSLTLQGSPDQNPFFAFHLKVQKDMPDHSTGTPSAVSDSIFFLADGRTLSLLYNIAEPAVLINSSFWNEGRHTIDLIARIPYDPQVEKPQRIFIEWRTLSEEFYKYHLSVARQISTLPLSDPDAVFNNIIGGYGTFAGYSTSVYTIELPQ